MGNVYSDTSDKKLTRGAHEITMEQLQAIYKIMRLPQLEFSSQDPKIFRVRHRTSKSPYILKRLLFSNLDDLQAFTKDLEYIIDQKHENLLEIYHYAIEQTQLEDLTLCLSVNVIMENFDYTLQQELEMREPPTTKDVKKKVEPREKTGKGFSESEVKTMLKTLVDAMQFMQLNGLCHGDLRPSQIFINDQNKYKLMFLGNIPRMTESGPEPQNSEFLGYLSPQQKIEVSNFFDMNNRVQGEQQTGAGFDPYKSDVFSLGLITLEVMCKNNLQGIDLSNLNSEVARRKQKIMVCDKNYSRGLCNIVKAMLRDSELIRPDFMDLKRLIIEEENPEQTREASPTKSVISPEMQILKSLTFEAKDGSPESQPKSPYLRKGNLMASIPLFKLEEITNNSSPNTQFYNGTNMEENLLEELKGADPILGDQAGKVVAQNPKRLKKLHEQGNKNIRKLVVNFENVDKISARTLARLSELVGWQKGLVELMIALPNGKVDDDKIELLCKGLNGLQWLKMCYFDFRKSNITDRGLETLGWHVGNMKRLEQLAVNLSDSNISKAGCWEISNWFGKLRQIKTLALNLGGNMIEKEGLDFVAKEIMKMENLEELTLYAYSNGLKGKETVKLLLENIDKLYNLEKLTLNLVDNLLDTEELDVVFEFLKTTELDVILDMKDNAVTAELGDARRLELREMENVMARFC